MLSRTKLARLGLPIAAVAAASAAMMSPALASPAPVSATPAADATAPVTPTCAWIDNSASTSNESSPDSSAVYWLLPIPVQPGLTITLDGRFADARYTSFTVYQPGGGLFTDNGVSSTLTDYQIQPDPGSINPWQWPTPGRRHHGRPGDKFTLTLQSDVSPGEANTLPIAPAGTTSGTGYMIYRVYLPAGNDFSRVPLPTVTFTLDGDSVQVPACPPAPATTTTLTPPATPPAASTDTSVQFSRTGSDGAATNADSGYLRSLIVPPTNGDVLVISGKAPRASKGNHPSPWPGPGIDVRYWSACIYIDGTSKPLVENQLPDGSTDYGCRNDSQTKINRSGYYTYVVGTEAQRAEINRIPGATFLPYSTADPTAKHDILLRNMLADPDFAEAIQNVPTSSTPADAAAVMGPYYPVAVLCPLASLTKPGGVAACLATAPSPSTS